MLRIGIDVGGTNTDAVVMDGRTVLAAIKIQTTNDITTGICSAISHVIRTARIDRASIRHVMIGTTHFTNAVIERRHLSKVAVIRFGLPAAACLPPLVDWPEDLRKMIGETAYMLRGGYEYDGRVLAEPDFDSLDRIADDTRERGIRSVAISSIFGPINDAHEKDARSHLLRRNPDLEVVLSSEVGSIGLLERENAAIMNAALLDLAGKTVDAFVRALQKCGLACGFSITQNDGTLMSAERVRRFPVMTFASGPTNSLRGAAFLTGLTEAIVVDIGGTTSDVGVLSKGFPRQAGSIVDIGGVRTNFRMPDILATGLGGGSIVSLEDSAVGPRSVGFRIASEALVFGGETLTATDIAVRMGLSDLGNAENVAHLPIERAQTAMANMHAQLGRIIDQCRTSADTIPVIAVGGGTGLMPDRIGDLEVITPDHSGVANAIGAAIAQTSGEIDRIVSLEGTSREAAIEAAKQDAFDSAVAAGAEAGSVGFLVVEDLPLSYLPGMATRVRVKAVGDVEMIK